MIAQAEHDPLARVAAVSEDRAVLERSPACSTARSPRSAVALRSSLASWLSARILVHARDRAQLLAVIDRFAPEHLSIQTERPMGARSGRFRALVRDLHRRRDAGRRRRLHRGQQSRAADVGGGALLVGPAHGGFLSHDVVDREQPRTRMSGDARHARGAREFEGLPAHARTALLRIEEG
jgi:hypothetical protein